MDIGKVRQTMETIKGTFHDAQTGETVERELTAEEVAKLPEAFFVEKTITEEAPLVEES